jgi:coenzyme F420 hydrogenase subunit beta
MEITKDGYSRPCFTRELRPSEREAIYDICPGVAQTCEQDDRKSDPFWGPYVSANTGFSTDRLLRHRAASGGALSGFLMSQIDNKNVDGVIHIKADPVNPLANVTTISTTHHEILEASGSRYAPSSPLDILPQLRGDDRRYAFVGKPCDVAALWSLRKRDPEIMAKVPILVSFFCAGVPSLNAGHELLRRMGAELSDVSRFQHRAEGWPGRATADLKDGGLARMSYSESWGEVLSKAVQHRCKICADGSGVFADVVFADAWEADADGYPSFKDQPGQSLVLARTELGHSLVRAAQVSGHLELSPYDLKRLASVQPGQVRRRRVLLARLAALRILGRPIPRYRGMGLWAMARRASPGELLRNFAGMVRRSLRVSVKGDSAC